MKKLQLKLTNKYGRHSVGGKNMQRKILVITSSLAGLPTVSEFKTKKMQKSRLESLFKRNESKCDSYNTRNSNEYRNSSGC